MMHRLCLAALSLCLLVPCVSAQGFDELLPDSTILYASVENVARTKERYEASSLSALWDDPAIQTFLEAPRKAWTKLTLRAKKGAGIDIENIIGVLSGQVVIAITGLSGDRKDNIQIMVLADVKGNDEKLRELLHLILANAEENERRVEEEEFRGISLTRISRTVDDEEKEAASYFHDEGLFAIASRAEDLRALIARRGEAEGTLASNEHYREVRGRLAGRSDVFLFLDAPRLVKALVEQGTFDEEGMTIFGALGLNSVRSVAMSAALADDGLRMRLLIPHIGEKEGILKIFAAKNRGRALPRWVPEDAVDAGVFAVDMAKLWDETVRVAEKISPGTGTMMQGSLEMVKGQTGVDIKKDMLDALGDEISYYTKLPGADEPGLAPLGAVGGTPVPRMVLSLRVKDVPRFEGALDTLLAGSGFEEQDYLGAKMRVIPLGIPGMQPAFALLPGELVFALHVDDLKEVISRYGKDVKGLVDSDRYERALTGMPAERAALGFSDTAKSLGSPLFWTGLLAGRGLAVDTSKLPTEELLRKYLGTSASVVVNEDHAIAFHSILRLKPRAKGDGDDESGDDSVGEDDGR